MRLGVVRHVSAGKVLPRAPDQVTLETALFTHHEYHHRASLRFHTNHSFQLIVPLLQPTHPQPPLISPMSIPSPRPTDSSRSSASSHVRRPSIPISPSLSPRVLPVPVPQRHGSMYSRKRPSVDAGSFGSVFLSSSLPSSAIIDPGGRPYDRDEEWLNCTAGEILRQAKEEPCPLVPGEKAAEEAVDVSRALRGQRS